MTQAVSRHPSATGETERALNMAARELLLLQASDWPFLITTGQAREYAVERFKGHVDRFHQLLEAVEAGGDADLVDRIWERDKVFPDIDYRWFAP
jgi:1,4-alpha-glucan branching enzyme